MKKLISGAACLLLLCSLAVSILAAPEGPVITLQPQSPTYSQYSVAIYTVKAEGKNLSAIWYMQWQDKTYTISDIGGAMQAWEPYAGEAYGARKLDDNTFSFTFEGVERELDGAYIWCVIEDGYNDVTSQKARISVAEVGMPPMIVDIPAQLTVTQGEEAQIRCVASAPGESQLSFLWYESDTGKLEDMRAVNRGTETADYIFCDTSAVGTRNYICKVETTDGGVAYSSFVPVTVKEKASKPQEETPEETTESTTDTAPPEKPEQPQPQETIPTIGAQQPPAEGMPWWAIVLIGLAGAAAGVGVAILLVKKKS